MKREKAVGYALIVIGLVFGIEGTAFTFAGTWVLGEVSEAVSFYSVFESQADAFGAMGFYSSLQTVLSLFVAYSLVKTLAGIACMLLGYKVLKAKK